MFVICKSKIAGCPTFFSGFTSCTSVMVGQVVGRPGFLGVTSSLFRLPRCGRFKLFLGTFRSDPKKSLETIGLLRSTWLPTCPSWQSQTGSWWMMPNSNEHIQFDDWSPTLTSPGFSFTINVWVFSSFQLIEIVLRTKLPSQPPGWHKLALLKVMFLIRAPPWSSGGSRCRRRSCLSLSQTKPAQDPDKSFGSNTIYSRNSVDYVGLMMIKYD